MSDRLFVTIGEACERIGISRAQGYRLAAADQFPVPLTRIGSRWKVSVALLEDFGATGQAVRTTAVTTLPALDVDEVAS